MILVCLFSCAFGWNTHPMYEYTLSGYGVNHDNVHLIEEVYIGKGDDGYFKCNALKKQREIVKSSGDDKYTYYFYECTRKVIEY